MTRRINNKTRKAFTWGRTAHFNNIFLVGPWTVTYVLDLRTWPRVGQAEPPSLVSRPNVTSFESYRTNTQTLHGRIAPYELPKCL